MDDIRFHKIIQCLDLQGQTWILCCYPSSQNKKFISKIKIKEENMYCIKTEDTNEETFFLLKKRKPDYVLVLESDFDLIDKTTFIYEWGGKHFFLKEDGYIMSRRVKSSIVEIEKNVSFFVSTEKIEYQQEYEKKVNEYWNYLINKGKKYYNGEMYSLIKVIEEENDVKFIFGKTNYKHLIYSKEHDFRNDFHTCTTASIAIIETKDGYSVLGKMSKDSAFANQYKCIGGALSSDDIVNAQIDINNMFRRELLEEIGIDIYDIAVCSSNMTKWLLIREKLAFVGVCNIISLNMTRDDLQKEFLAFQEKDDEKEVSSLLFVKSFDEILAIEERKKADYVDELYRCYYLKTAGISWEQYNLNYSPNTGNWR